MCVSDIHWCEKIFGCQQRSMFPVLTRAALIISVIAQTVQVWVHCTSVLLEDFCFKLQGLWEPEVTRRTATQRRAETPGTRMNRGSPQTWRRWCFLRYKKTSRSSVSIILSVAAHMWLCIFVPFKCFFFSSRWRLKASVIYHLTTSWLRRFGPIFSAILSPVIGGSFKYYVPRAASCVSAESLSDEALFDCCFEDVLLPYSACLFPAFPRIRQTTRACVFPPLWNTKLPCSKVN